MKDAPKVYLTRAGRNGEDEECALENNRAIIGFEDVLSLEGAKNYDAVVELVNDALPGEKPRALGNFAGQLWAFAIAMQEGGHCRPATQAHGTDRHRPGDGALSIRPGEQGVSPHTARGVVAAGRTTRHIRAGPALFVWRVMTVCNISRNDAARRVAAVLEGNPDPGPSVLLEKPTEAPLPTEGQTAAVPDLAQLAHDQIVAQIQSRFAGHALARLVDAVLEADGWVTKISVPGPDGGVDILAGRGSLGLDAPRLCVQVKSQNSPADVTVYRTLQGTMQTFKAEQGLLVCWGGFNKVVLAESRQGHFMVRLWDSRDLVGAILPQLRNASQRRSRRIAPEAGVDACRRGACGRWLTSSPIPQ